MDVNESYRNFADRSDMERQESARYVNQEIQRLDNGWDELDTFNVDDFVSALAKTSDREDFIVLDPAFRDPTVSTVVMLTPTASVFGDTEVYEAEVPVNRGAMPDTGRMLADVEAALSRGVPMPPFPIMSFELRPENRPSTRDSTMGLYDHINRSGYSFLFPEMSAMTYCFDSGLAVHVAEPELSTQVKYTPGKKKKYFQQFVTLQEMRDYAKAGEQVIGFMINPYQPASHEQITSIKREGDYYDVHHTQGYRHYHTKVRRFPGYCEQGVYRYSLDAWSSYLKVKIKSLHPKWYAYDMVSSFEIKMDLRKYVHFSSDFLGLEVTHVDGKPFTLLMDGTGLGKRMPEWKTAKFRSWAYTPPIRASKVKVKFRPMELLSRSEDGASCFEVATTPPTRIFVLLKGLVPQHDHVVRKNGTFYFWEYDSSGESMIKLDLSIFREYMGHSYSFVSDVNVCDMTHYTFVNSKSRVVSMHLRSYLLEPDLAIREEFPEIELPMSAKVPVYDVCF